jgi:hypothetical protein
MCRGDRRHLPKRLLTPMELHGAISQKIQLSAYILFTKIVDMRRSEGTKEHMQVETQDVMEECTIGKQCRL